MAHDNPVDQVAQLVADARQAFAKDVDDLLTEFSAECNYLGGTLTREDWRHFRRLLLEKFDSRLPLKPHADQVLRQLIRDVHAWLTNPEAPIDVEQWITDAGKVLDGEHGS
jgi:hypothetical protein